MCSPPIRTTSALGQEIGREGDNCSADGTDDAGFGGLRHLERGLGGDWPSERQEGRERVDRRNCDRNSSSHVYSRVPTLCRQGWRWERRLERETPYFGRSSRPIWSSCTTLWLEPGGTLCRHLEIASTGRDGSDNLCRSLLVRPKRYVIRREGLYYCEDRQFRVIDTTKGGVRRSGRSVPERRWSYLRSRRRLGLNNAHVITHTMSSSILHHLPPSSPTGALRDSYLGVWVSVRISRFYSLERVGHGKSLLAFLLWYTTREKREGPR